MGQQRWRLISKDRKSFIESIRSPEALKALEKLEPAGVIQQVFRTNPEVISIGVTYPINMVMNF